MTTRAEFLQRNREAIIRSDEDLERYRLAIEKEDRERGFLLHKRLATDFTIESLPRFLRVIKRIGISIASFVTLHYISKFMWKKFAPETYRALSKSGKISLAEK